MPEQCATASIRARSAAARPRRWRVLLGLGLLALAGCHTEASKREVEFDVLIRKLPGKYDNLAQAKSDATGEHAAVALLIKPVNAIAVGKIVLFVRETAADDPRRVLAQHLWVFDLDKKHRLVQAIYLFKEPPRWLHAAEDPYLLESLLPDDLSLLAGCELIWIQVEPPPSEAAKAPSGKSGAAKPEPVFKGATKPDSCKASAGAEGLLIEQSAELHGTELLLNEQLSGAGGSLEDSAASSYRFERRSGQAQPQ
jgi:hypothetical protein